LSAGLASGWLHRALPGLSPRERLERAWRGGWKTLLLEPSPAEEEEARERLEWIHAIRQGPMDAAAVQAGPTPLFEEEPYLGPGREGPASPAAPARQAALRDVEAALEQARRCGCPRILVRPGLLPVPSGWKGDLLRSWEDLEEKRALVEELRAQGRDQALDRVCRFLHGLSRRAEGALLCLRNGFDLAGLDRPQDLAALVEDLGPRRVRIWVDAGAAALRELAGDGTLGGLLEEAAPWMEGLSLGDVRPGEAGLPPGMGRLDLPLLRDYGKTSGSQRPWILELGPSFGWETLAPALDGWGASGPGGSPP